MSIPYIFWSLYYYNVHVLNPIDICVRIKIISSFSATYYCHLFLLSHPKTFDLTRFHFVFFIFSSFLLFVFYCLAVPQHMLKKKEKKIHRYLYNVHVQCMYTKTSTYIKLEKWIEKITLKKNNREKNGNKIEKRNFKNLHTNRKKYCFKKQEMRNYKQKVKIKWFSLFKMSFFFIFCFWSWWYCCCCFWNCT